MTENQRHTPGPWTAYRMVHEATNEPMSPEQVGEYVRNSVVKSAGESGSLDFLFVSVEKPDGPADVCHVGNGPTSPANACLIAAAPDLLASCKELREAMAGAMRVIAEHGALVEAFEAEMRRIGAKDGFGVRVEEAVAKAEGAANLTPLTHG